MISIIIPCFNCEKYIGRCIESIKKQTNQNYECIIVNDGSSDNSGNIINDLANDKFKLINQSNQGVSSARNTGLDNAKGDYICFIDADDYVVGNYVEVLIKNINKFPDADILHFNTKNNFYSSSVWAKCFKKSFIEKFNIKFPENGVLGQDMAFCEKCKVVTDKIIFIDQKLYYYEINDQSATNNIEKRFKIYNSIDDLLLFCECHEKMIDPKRLDEIIYKHGILYPRFFLLDKNISDKKKYLKVINDAKEKYSKYLSFKHKNCIYITLNSYSFFIKNKIINILKSIS